MPRNLFTTNWTQPRYHRNGDWVAKDPKYQRTYEEELLYSYNSPTKPKDSRKKHSGVAPSKYDHVERYPESYGDSMMQDHAPPPRKDSRMDSTEDIVPFGYSSTQTTLNEADFEDRLPPNKGAPTKKAKVEWQATEPEAGYRDQIYERPVRQGSSASAISIYPRGEAFRKRARERFNDFDFRKKPTRRGSRVIFDKQHRKEKDRTKSKLGKKGEIQIAYEADQPYLDTTTNVGRKATINDVSARRDDPEQLQGFRYEDQPIRKAPTTTKPPDSKKESDLKLRDYVDKFKGPLRRNEIANDPHKFKRDRPVDPEAPKVPAKERMRAHIKHAREEVEDQYRIHRAKKNGRSNSFASKEDPKLIRQPGQESSKATTGEKSKKQSSKEAKSKHQVTNDISGLREQIIANAHALFPALALPRHQSFTGSNFDVVIIPRHISQARATTYTAYLLNIGNPQDADQTLKVGTSDPSTTPSEALLSLLELTGAALAKLGEEDSIFKFRFMRSSHESDR